MLHNYLLELRKEGETLPSPTSGILLGLLPHLHLANPGGRARWSPSTHLSTDCEHNTDKIQGK